MVGALDVDPVVPVLDSRAVLLVAVEAGAAVLLEPVRFRTRAIVGALNGGAVCAVGKGGRWYRRRRRGWHNRGQSLPVRHSQTDRRHGSGFVVIVAAAGAEAYPDSEGKSHGRHSQHEENLWHAI